MNVAKKHNLTYDEVQAIQRLLDLSWSLTYLPDKDEYVLTRSRVVTR